ncbi:MAG: nitroreductase family protein [Spirochaetia bacterium]
MNFLELVSLRRSVRTFENKPVPREELEKCVEAARLAPSACNSQPWHFIIVDDPVLLSKIAPLTSLPPSKLNKFVKNAPVLIALVSEKQNLSAKLGSIALNKPLELIDIGIAAEHFCLQAAELGIGTCMLGWLQEKKVKKLLGVPKDRSLPLLIAAGYPATDMKSKTPKQRKSLSDILSYGP